MKREAPTCWLAGAAQWHLIEDRVLHVDDWFGGDAPTTAAGKVADVPGSARLVDDAVDAAEVAPG